MRYDVYFSDGQASEGLRRLQEVQTEMLGQFLAFCDEKGLRPFLVAGSALGSVRHSGFIPWDDDVDVGLMREDYKKFLSLTRRQPIPDLFVQTSETDPAYPLAYAKLRKLGTAVGESGFEGIEVEKGIFIDVFPFDILPQSMARRYIQYALLSLLNAIITSFSWNLASSAESRMTRAIRRFAYLLRPVLPWRRAITLRERIADPQGPKRSRRAICFEMYGLRKAKRTIISVSDLSPPSTGRFEALLVPLPHDPGKYLASIFGDYIQLPPEECRRPQHIEWVEVEP